MQKLVKPQKSKTNPMLSISLIEENTELSHIHLAVKRNKTYETLSKNLVKLSLIELRRYEEATKLEKSPTCFDKTAVFTQ